MPVEYFIKRCKKQFDFIFFDPPFPYKYHEQLILQSDENGMLKEDGLIMVHRPEEHFMPDSIGKKLRVGDVITIPHDALEIEIVEPTPAEKEEHQQEMAEKKRVADLVKTLNKQAKTKTKKDQPKQNKTRKPVRFPGT